MDDDVDAKRGRRPSDVDVNIDVLFLNVRNPVSLTEHGVSSYQSKVECYLTFWKLT